METAHLKRSPGTDERSGKEGGGVACRAVHSLLVVERLSTKLVPCIVVYMYTCSLKDTFITRDMWARDFIMRNTETPWVFAFFPNARIQSRHTQALRSNSCLFLCLYCIALWTTRSVESDHPGTVKRDKSDEQKSIENKGSNFIEDLHLCVVVQQQCGHWISRYLQSAARRTYTKQYTIF